MSKGPLRFVVAPGIPGTSVRHHENPTSTSTARVAMAAVSILRMRASYVVQWAPIVCYAGLLPMIPRQSLQPRL